MQKRPYQCISKNLEKDTFKEKLILRKKKKKKETAGWPKDLLNVNLKRVIILNPEEIPQVMGATGCPKNGGEVLKFRIFRSINATNLENLFGSLIIHIFFNLHLGVWILKNTFFTLIFCFGLSDWRWQSLKQSIKMKNLSKSEKLNACWRNWANGTFKGVV